MDHSTDSKADRFPQGDVDAVVGHMNRDHTGDALLIAQAFGEVPTATAAHTLDVDKLGIVIEATVDGGPVEVRVPWSERLEERPQLRPEIAGLYRRACAALGVPARGEAEH